MSDVLLREAYGDALSKYGKINERVVVLDSDLANSTKTVRFQEVCKDRFFNVGIAEANMVSMAAGFASSGYIPFVNTFATLIASMGALAAKSIIGYSGLNVRLIGSNNGLSGGYDGCTHHSYDDINVMRAIPNMLIMSPSDQTMVDWMISGLCDEYFGPAYVSLPRSGKGKIYPKNEKFEIGKAKPVNDGKDVTVFAYGLSVQRARKAKMILEKENIDVRIYDMFTLKPIDKEAIITAATETGAIVTVEEHSIVGGLGSAVGEVLAENQLAIPFERVGILDCYTQSGSYEELVKEYKMDDHSIVSAIKRAVSKK